MGKSCPPQYTILGACMAPASLQDFPGFGTLPHGREGLWRNPLCPCMTAPPGATLGVWGPLTHKDRNVTIHVRVDDVHELGIAGI